MQSIHALSLAPDVNNWLANSSQPRILHIFDHACNLINERGEVLSVVSPEIGNGPFNLVIPRLRKSHERLADSGASWQTSEVFLDHLHAQSLISIRAGQLTLGDLTVKTTDAELWSPRPDWDKLHARRDDILNHILSLRGRESSAQSNPLASWEIDFRGPATTLPFAKYQSPISDSVASALATADLASSLTAARKLAGLGQGLTPAGDDFILGAVFAAWIIHPPEIARKLAEEITDTAALLTASLSAAWLRSAGKGEAGILWHDFFNALNAGDESAIQLQFTKILSMGHTSGADSLSGFIGVFTSWMEIRKKELTVHEDSPG